MARGRGSKPTHYIAVTAKVGKGKYEKGPYIGLWEGDDDRGPLFRGSVSGKYLDELYDFIKDYGEDAVSFAVFESRGGGKSRRNRDEDDEDAAPRGRRGSSRRSSREEEEDDEPKDKRGSRGRGKRDEKDDEKEERGGRRGGKGKGDWWDD